MQLFQVDPEFQTERVSTERVPALRDHFSPQSALEEPSPRSADNLAHYATYYRGRPVALTGVHVLLPEAGWDRAEPIEQFGVFQAMVRSEAALVVSEWRAAQVERRLQVATRLEALRPLIANMRSLRLRCLYWGASEEDVGILQRMFGFRVVASSTDHTGLRCYLLRLDYARSLQGLVSCAQWLTVDAAQEARWAIRMPARMPP